MTFLKFYTPWTQTPAPNWNYPSSSTSKNSALPWNLHPQTHGLWRLFLCSTRQASQSLPHWAVGCFIRFWLPISSRWISPELVLCRSLDTPLQHIASTSSAHYWIGCIAALESGILDNSRNFGDFISLGFQAFAKHHWQRLAPFAAFAIGNCASTKLLPSWQPSNILQPFISVTLMRSLSIPTKSPTSASTKLLTRRTLKTLTTEVGWLSRNYPWVNCQLTNPSRSFMCWKNLNLHPDCLLWWLKKINTSECSCYSCWRNPRETNLEFVCYFQTHVHWLYVKDGCLRHHPVASSPSNVQATKSREASWFEAPAAGGVGARHRQSCHRDNQDCTASCTGVRLPGVNQKERSHGDMWS